MRAVDLVLKNADTDANVNVSVFETNIRVVGGLLSAHLMSARVKGKCQFYNVLMCNFV
jgi:mannosidase alpha-like ER degradation enhancer 2